ncbi:hypothetical protein Trydic_g17238 [Trypoxylus dichotomus]
MTIVVGIHFSGYKVPYDLVTKIMPLLPDSSVKWQLFGSAIVATMMWLTVIYIIRYTLKLLLMYKGWMYEARVAGINQDYTVSKVHFQSFHYHHCTIVWQGTCDLFVLF